MTTRTAPGRPLVSRRAAAAVRSEFPGLGARLGVRTWAWADRRQPTRAATAPSRSGLAYLRR
ncbi:hypothetical protein FRAAL0049 [Frankia alni ACN14a]|uniref:Uncharacterized protein n=1 Tax=Frankia alni (strain DSM 45986 / CECT 9034 / ACN14a) TaxID=326424 RepID=Q0RUK7_FRAAA|nr:hypothetical protein FRAAL0049 [Frankia alni ACN14a]